MKRKCMICAKLKLVYKIINDFKTKQKCLEKFVSIIFYKIMKSIFARGIEDICDKNGGEGIIVI